MKKRMTVLLLLTILFTGCMDSDIEARVTALEQDVTRLMEQLESYVNETNESDSSSSMNAMKKSLTDENVTDDELKQIGEMTELRELSIAYFSEGVSDLSPLSGLINLQTLTLGKGNYISVESLLSLTSLTSLSLYIDNLTDFSTLVELPCLTALTVTSEAKSLPSLSDFRSLTSLTVDDWAITDISFLTEMQSLENLTVLSWNLHDVSPISELYHLKSLYLVCGTGQAGADALSGLTSLENLRFGCSTMSDFAVFGGLTSLKKLTLGSNLVKSAKNLSIIADLETLETFTITDSGRLPENKRAEVENLFDGIEVIFD